MIYYGNQRRLEYDFIVAPGTDPGRISLDFQDPRKADLDRNGDLVMRTSAGDLRWHEPIAYQEVNGSRKHVKCTYVRNNGYLAFSVDTYDRAKPLIIDPVLDYSTYLGGSGGPAGDAGDAGQGMAVDADGNAYVTGFTSSPNFPVKDARFNEG